MFPESPTRKKLDLAGTWQYSFDGKIWRDVQVPSAFDYTGTFILRREFDVAPELLDRRLFSLVVYFTRYVSLGSLCAAVGLPVTMAFLGKSREYVTLSLLMGFLLIYTHRENIHRLLAGQESKFGAPPRK